jgi:Sodium/hydrogen exchanger family
VNEAEQTDYVNATDDNINKSLESDEAEEYSPETSLQSRPSFEDDTTIPWRTAHMMWFSGLRGAVSYGLVRTFPDSENKATIVVTTMMLILLTTFLLGGTTELVLNCLHVPVGIDEEQYLQSIDKRKLLPGFLLRFENNKLFAWAVRDDVKKVDIKKSEDDADDPELTPYENIEVEHGNEHADRISIVQTNRNGKIFDYGA